MGDTAGRAARDMTEDELLDRAGAAMSRAMAHPRGSVGWSVQWAAHDAAMDELAVRAALAGALGERMRRQAIAIVSRR